MRISWNAVRDVFRRDRPPSDRGMAGTLDAAEMLRQARGHCGAQPSLPEPKGLDWVDQYFSELRAMTDYFRQLTGEVEKFNWNLNFRIRDYEWARFGGVWGRKERHIELEVFADHTSGSPGVVGIYLGSALLSDVREKERLALTLRRDICAPFDKKDPKEKLRARNLDGQIVEICLLMTAHVTTRLHLPHLETPARSYPENPTKPGSVVASPAALGENAPKLLH